MGFVNEIVGDKWQTVDHKRNLRLETISGARGEYEFRLYVEGEFVSVYAIFDSKVHGHPKIGEKTLCDMKWQLKDVFIPPSLKDKKSIILDYIREALEVRGSDFKQDNIHSTEVSLLKNAVKQVEP